MLFSAALRRRISKYRERALAPAARLRNAATEVWQEKLPHPIRFVRRAKPVFEEMRRTLASYEDQQRWARFQRIKNDPVDIFEGIEVAETFDPYMQAMVADHEARQKLLAGVKG